MRILWVRVFVLRPVTSLQSYFGPVFRIMFLVYFASLPSVVLLCHHSTDNTNNRFKPIG